MQNKLQDKKILIVNFLIEIVFILFTEFILKSKYKQLGIKEIDVEKTAENIIQIVKAA